MAPSFDSATLVILDIGANTSTPLKKNEKPFFESARLCAMRIIERNIMMQSKNLVGLIWLGSNKTKNPLAEQCKGAFKYIEIASELQSPTWKMIRDLPNKTSPQKGDWFDALIVAAHHYTEGISNFKINSKKIVLISNFEAPANVGKKFLEAISGFQDENFEVYVIGPDMDSLDNANAKYVKQFVDKTGGDTATFDEAINGWLFYKKKATKVVPQNFDLSLSPNVKIPISAYIRIRDEPVLKNWQKAVKDPVTLTASTSECVIKEKKIVNTENQAVLESKDIIKGYLYGQKIIPFSDSDKTMLYQSGDRSLSIYGFTPISNIGWQNLHGDGTYYVFGRKGNEKAQTAVNCLVNTLHEMKLAGIVRKVHAKNYEPKMFALIPVLDSKYICLSLIGICYKEEIKHMSFPPTELKKYNCTEEQVNAFKELISSMDLTKAYDETFYDSEAFPIAETVSPSIQHALDSIAFRAMNPGKPLPQPRDEIMTLFKVPPQIEKHSRQPIDKIKKLFTLKKVEKKTKKKGTVLSDAGQLQTMDQTINNASNQLDNEMPKINFNTAKDDKVNYIGAMDPIRDFEKLKSEGKTLAELTPEMTEVIENLIYIGENKTKAVKVMKKFREECVKSEPCYYNNWLQKFKRDLMVRKKDDVLEILLQNSLNYIVKEENSLSTFTETESHEDNQLYENDTVPNSTELTIAPEVNDLFDEM